MHYRLFLLNASGRFRGVVERECSSDAEAVLAAEALRETRCGVEIWSGERLVARLGVNVPFLSFLDALCSVRE